MNRSEPLSSVNPISDFFVQHNSHRRVDRIFLAFAAATEYYASRADLLALQGTDKAGSRCHHRRRVARVWKLPGILNAPRITSLELHHLAEFFQRFAGRK